MYLFRGISVKFFLCITISILFSFTYSNSKMLLSLSTSNVAYGFVNSGFNLKVTHKSRIMVDRNGRFARSRARKNTRRNYFQTCDSNLKQFIIKSSIPSRSFFTILKSTYLDRNCLVGDDILDDQTEILLSLRFSNLPVYT